MFTRTLTREIFTCADRENYFTDSNFNNLKTITMKDLI